MIGKISPCINVCTIDESSGFCVGCLRSRDEISVWGYLNPTEREMIWAQLGNRRMSLIRESVIQDQMQRLIRIKSPIQKIVSLVPSLSQTLYDLGLEQSVVGITRFCPKGQIRKTSIGGTKNPNFSKIQLLEPDIILANKEENHPSDVQQLENRFPVWVSDICSFDEALAMISSFGEYFDRYIEAQSLIEKIKRGLASIQSTKSKTAAYFIWKNPYMVTGGDTFINTWLEHLGFKNIFADSKRYPETKLEDLAQNPPETIFLSDEPYFFREEDRKHFTKIFPRSEIHLVKGKYFSWYGSLILEAIAYFSDLAFEARRAR